MQSSAQFTVSEFQFEKLRKAASQLDGRFLELILGVAVRQINRKLDDQENYNQNSPGFNQRDIIFQQNMTKFMSRIFHQISGKSKQHAELQSKGPSTDEISDKSIRQLFKGILKEILLRSEACKRSLKEKQNLPKDEVFQVVPIHRCRFCEAAFRKPASLGGHISKLHRGRKIHRDQMESSASNMESPVIVEEHPERIQE